MSLQLSAWRDLWRASAGGLNVHTVNGAPSGAKTIARPQAAAEPLSRLVFACRSGRTRRNVVTFAHYALDTNVAFMGIDHVFDNLGAESCSAGLSADAREQKRGCHGFLEAYHALYQSQKCRARRTSGRDLSDNGDGSAGGNLWNGIVHQVVEGVEESLFVGLDRRQTYRGPRY